MEPKILCGIECFVQALSEALEENLLAVYLYGSVPLQDYREGWSDIDLLCLTKEPLSVIQAESLLRIRQRLVDTEKNPLFRKMEGAVLCAEELFMQRYTRLVYWGTSGQKITDTYTFDVFSMLSLMRYGVLLFGTDIREKLSVPTHEELLEGVRRHYQTIRTYAQKTTESVYSCGWLLDIARCLYTLRYDDMISKTEAGEWALRENLCPCREDMEKALAVRRDPVEMMTRAEAKGWLCSLGPSVQKFADVLQQALKNATGYAHVYEEAGLPLDSHQLLLTRAQRIERKSIQIKR